MPSPFKNPGRGRPRETVREIPCQSCQKMFGQTQHEMDRKVHICPECASKERKLRKPKRLSDQVFRANHRLEVVLLAGAKLDRKRDEWYVGARVRRRHSDEEFKPDKIYLGLPGDAPRDQVERAYTSTCARLQLEGARTKSGVKAIKAKRGTEKHWTPWNKGKMCRDVGVSRVKVVRFRVRLPDPLKDGETRLIGTFDSLSEARKRRNAAYFELAEELLPCACCGVKPTWRGGMLAHVSSLCRNDLRFPQGITRLIQAKLWNQVFASGTKQGTGKITKEWLAERGYLFFNGKNYLRRADVELHLSAASQYATVQESDDPVFE